MEEWKNLYNSMYDEDIYKLENEIMYEKDMEGYEEILKILFEENVIKSLKELYKESVDYPSKKGFFKKWELDDEERKVKEKFWNYRDELFNVSLNMYNSNKENYSKKKGYEIVLYHMYKEGVDIVIHDSKWDVSSDSRYDFSW